MSDEKPPTPEDVARILDISRNEANVIMDVLVMSVAAAMKAVGGAELLTDDDLFEMVKGSIPAMLKHPGGHETARMVLTAALARAIRAEITENRR